MQRALWKGAISYGLVHIPDELILGSRDHELDLSMLERRDFATRAGAGLTALPPNIKQPQSVAA